jgi:hypothetical protein
MVNVRGRTQTSLPFAQSDELQRLLTGPPRQILHGEDVVIMFTRSQFQVPH